LGLPYGFASHFAPQALDQALQIYREGFQPSHQQAVPYAMVGLNIIAGETDLEAKRLATSQQVSFADLVRGQPSLLQPPIEQIEDYEFWTPQVEAQANQMLACRIVGGPETVRSELRSFLDRTAADELIIVSDLFDSEKRFRSFELVAEIVQSM